MNLSALVGTLALALFNASAENPLARSFAYAYAVLCVIVLVCSQPFYSITPVLVVMRMQLYGYILYQHRITMIRRRDPGHFGAPQKPSLNLIDIAHLICKSRPTLRTDCHINVPLLCSFSQLYCSRQVHAL